MTGLQGESRALFPATRWSLVRSAASGSGEALEELCDAYATPVYAYFRREGYPPAEAEDLTQEFFAVKVLDPERRGAVLRDDAQLSVRFRSFLRVCLRNFASHDRERRKAQKRGGGVSALPLDLAAAERSLALCDDAEPGRAFDLSWARCVVDRVFGRLQAEIGADAKLVLRRTLQAKPDREIADEMGVSANAVAKTRKRTLDRARKLLDLELRETVADVGELSAEVAELSRIYALPGWLAAT